MIWWEGGEKDPKTVDIAETQTSTPANSNWFSFHWSDEPKRNWSRCRESAIEKSMNETVNENLAHFDWLCQQRLDHTASKSQVCMVCKNKLKILTVSAAPGVTNIAVSFVRKSGSLRDDFTDFVVQHALTKIRNRRHVSHEQTKRPHHKQSELHRHLKPLIQGLSINCTPQQIHKWWHYHTLQSLTAAVQHHLPILVQYHEIFGEHIGDLDDLVTPARGNLLPRSYAPRMLLKLCLRASSLVLLYSSPA